MPKTPRPLGSLWRYFDAGTILFLYRFLVPVGTEKSRQSLDNVNFKVNI
jgi:hypothetical protein